MGDIVCKHGALKRQCEVCELTDRVDELRSVAYNNLDQRSADDERDVFAVLDQLIEEKRAHKARVAALERERDDAITTVRTLKRERDLQRGWYITQKERADSLAVKLGYSEGRVAALERTFCPPGCLHDIPSVIDRAQAHGWLPPEPTKILRAKVAALERERDELQAENRRMREHLGEKAAGIAGGIDPIPCGVCGGALQFVDGSGDLKCPACAVQALTAADKLLLEWMADYNDPAMGPEARATVVACTRAHLERRK